MFCRVTRVMAREVSRSCLPSRPLTKFNDPRLLHFGKPPKKYRIQMKVAVQIASGHCQGGLAHCI